MQEQESVVMRTAGVLRTQQAPPPAEIERAATEQAIAEEALRRGCSSDIPPSEPLPARSITW